MHLLIIGADHMADEFRAKFGSTHTYTFWSADSVYESGDTDEDYEARFQLAWQPLHNALPQANAIFVYQKARWNFLPANIPVFQDTSASGSESFSYLLPGVATVFGFCGLPTLLNRSLLEVSLYHEADREKLAETCAALGTDYRVVADRVGLVTPRVICQIINEACFTVQEGTATMQDVDLGMKLGTSYPRGPFAWANAIGVERVYAVLEAMWDDTHDERYKVCPLLKRQALRGEPFAV